VLEKSNIRIGERIEIKAGKNVYSGILMPRVDLGDTNSIVLKLDSGYNIGIKYNDKIRLKPAKTKTPKKVREEYKAETGKEKLHITLPKFSPEKPNIAFIATGGTILSRVEYKTGGVSPIEKPEDLLLTVPGLELIANIKDILVPFRKASEDIDYTDWQKLAELVAKEVNNNEGVIIAHGTDTMHYTSAALSFMLKNLSKPVVLVGAQRSSDRGSSDAAMNLLCSAYASVSDIAEVGICMHETINDDFCALNRGTRVRKVHTTRRDAFKSFNDYPLARIYPGGRLEILTQNYRPRSTEETVADTRYEPKVALLKTYPNSDPEVLYYYVSKGYKGFVIEGTGMGHVPTKALKSWIPYIKEIIMDGIPVVITSQTLFGRVNEYVYENLRILYKETGAFYGEDMIPEVALIKLGWVIGHTKSFDQIKKMMSENLAGEITRRTLIR